MPMNSPEDIWETGEMKDKDSVSGITVHYEDGISIPLEEFIAKEEAKEKRKEIEEEKASDKYAIYHKPQIRINSNGKKVSYTKVYSKEEINKMTWGKLLKKSVIEKDLTKAVLSVLLCGEYISIEQWTDAIWKEDLEGKVFDRNKIKFRIRYLVNKSPIKNLLAVNKCGKANIYTLIAEAKSLTLDQLYLLYHKNSPEEEISNIYNTYPVVAQLLESNKGVKGKDDRRVISVESPTDKEDSTPEAKSILNKAISDLLGLEISGAVDINININVNIRQ